MFVPALLGLGTVVAFVLAFLIALPVGKRLGKRSIGFGQESAGHDDLELGRADLNQFEAVFVVDATGRDTLLASQFGIKQKSKKQRSGLRIGLRVPQPRCCHPERA